MSWRRQVSAVQPVTVIEYSPEKAGVPGTPRREALRLLTPNPELPAR